MSDIVVEITSGSIVVVDRNRGYSGVSGFSGKSGFSGANPGASGVSGTSGVSGSSGRSGASGTSGTSGKSGTSGRSGYSGSSGTSGVSGSSGSSGSSGTSGFSGSSGTSGVSGTSGISGKSGTSGISGTSGVSGGGGAWTSFTPSWTNLTVGNAVVTAAYNQTGKTVNARVTVVWGNTTSIAGAVRVSLPVTSISYPGTVDVMPLGNTGYLDATGSTYQGVLVWESTTTALLQVVDTSGTYGIRANVNATVPYTWTTSDEIHLALVYEAA